MSSPDTADAPSPSLAQDWLYALRYWLRGPRGIAVLVVSALVVGAALNWSWLVAVGIAPLLLTVLPCAVMCGLGLCMNRIMGGSCSTSSSAADQPCTPMPKIASRVTAGSESDNRAPVSDTAGAGGLPDLSIGSAVAPVPEQLQVLKERE
jgi:hypothetical protein